jgi:signal transduction histidine kinase
MKFFARSLRGLGGDRIVWRIAGTIILAILGTQIATIVLLRSTRPADMPLYSIEALIAEMQRHVSGQPEQSDGILIRVSDVAFPAANDLYQPFPFRDVQYRLQESLSALGDIKVRVQVDQLRPPSRVLFWPAPVPRIGMGGGGHPPSPGFGPPPPPGMHPGGPPPRGREPRQLPHEDFQVPGIFTLWIQKQAAGDWMAYRARVSYEPMSPAIVTALWILLILSIIAGLAFWSTWRLLRPVKQLVAAAQGWRAEQEPTPVPERGPLEFRTIASAFNDMQGKINQFVKARAELVIALSHDLRTPLTRLRLRAEYIEDSEQRQRMLDELHFMELLTDQIQSFGSFNPRNEAIEKVDLAVLLITLCDDRNDAGAVVEYSGPAHLPFACRPTAILRAMMNLVDNAVKYSDYAYVSIENQPNGVHIIIRDSGPGIPEEELEKVFQPFYRVDASRSRETGGLGMGLSVARAIILEHLGNIVLRNRRPNGLEVEVFLPLRPL